MNLTKKTVSSIKILCAFAVMTTITVSRYFLKNPCLSLTKKSSLENYNGNAFHAEDQQYNLLTAIYNPLESNRTPDECCNEEYMNSQRLQQDHPCVIEIIRQKYLYYPSAKDSSPSEDSTALDPSAGQTSIVLPFLGNKTGGFFVEGGAGDGYTLSNTFYMEKQLKWNGLLIEANRKFFTQILARKRQAYATPVCISAKPYPTVVSFYEDGIAGGIYGDVISKMNDIPLSDKSYLVNVQCFPLYSILLAVGRTTLDYFSVDVEGNESQILESVPWHRVDIKALTVEVTSRRRAVVDSLIQFMVKKGYKKVRLMEGLGLYDLVFVQNDLH